MAVARETYQRVGAADLQVVRHRPDAPRVPGAKDVDLGQEALMRGARALAVAPDVLDDRRPAADRPLAAPDDRVPGEHLAEADPVAQVHITEVARLQPLDGLDVRQ